MLACMQPRSEMDIKALLRHTPLFEGLDGAVLDEMLSHFRHETWKQGRRISEQDGDAVSAPA